MLTIEAEERMKYFYLPILPVPLGIIAVIIISTQFSCDTTEPPEKNILSLSLEDVSCTEAWLKLSSTLHTSIALTLKQDEKSREIINLTSTDTILYIDSLQPNKTYTFQAIISAFRRDPVSDGQPFSRVSNELCVTTLETTSHNFTFQAFTFGDAGAGSSTLYDVAIIDENNIWVVGAIYLKDSLGNPDPHAYNAVHWNGEKWELKRIKYYGNCSAVELPPLKAIWAFAENNIVVTNGGSIGWFDGENITLDCGVNSLLRGAINKIWGTSSSYLYIAGNGGSIAHHYNGEWQKIESGTDLPIQDTWGIYDKENDDNEIMCIASDKYYGGGPELFKIENNNVIPLPIEGLLWSISSIWFKNKYKTYIVGDDIFVRDYPNDKWKNITEGITTYYIHSIRGSGNNDIVVSGAGGELVHFNGSTWRSYRGNSLPAFYGNYYSAAIKENIICAVGEAVLDKSKAIIVLGFR